MKRLNNDLSSIYGDVNAWDFFENQLNSLSPTKIFVLTDVNTNKHCLPYFFEKTGLKKQVQVLTIAAGEVYKNISTCVVLWNELSQNGADRDSLLINLGGGVVTDLGGFVACTFKRGIPFINIPTSLLAMVDASVGGKNGVDLGSLKNQVGVIKNPLQVLIDIAFLETLPRPQLVSGHAEMLKHGLIYSKAYWDKVQYFDLDRKIEASDLIWESVLIKNEVVTEDPREKGRRKTLNYGHTLGHAIESYFMEVSQKNTSTKALLHGEAIAIGMILATYLSYRLCSFPKKKLETITSTIISFFGKVSFERHDIEEIITLLAYDKKNRGGTVYFVLLTDIGQYKINCTVENKLIFEAFDYYEKS
ncbi:3-dehydroquinate synthase [Marixanthomonas spongiae]|uniref:3-dehydroquinate synthase n=1 Tax=Marixanthomonas spongiae TaxID=2174845 RepID=A0A2U0HY91_9FLAO|nr:3-dehydroquinate synthase [Marixanthomonas spongiae]PVW13825.1 3-dehydroquinate synthase [Marixanthomonas spongiae]